MLTVVSACTSGRCRERNVASQSIFVFKHDGSKQCEKKAGLTAEEMSKQLMDIKVVSKQSKTDGMMHMMVCGSPTGKVNVYEINSADLVKAQQLGFEVFKNEN
jgi:hypothetical protein